MQVDEISICVMEERGRQDQGFVAAMEERDKAEKYKNAINNGSIITPMRTGCIYKPGRRVGEAGEL
jgi:hypothetical protein